MITNVVKAKNGVYYYYIDGKRVTKDKYDNLVNRKK